MDQTKQKKVRGLNFAGLSHYASVINVFINVIEN